MFPWGRYAGRGGFLARKADLSSRISCNIIWGYVARPGAGVEFSGRGVAWRGRG